MSPSKPREPSDGSQAPESSDGPWGPAQARELANLAAWLEAEVRRNDALGGWRTLAEKHHRDVSVKRYSRQAQVCRAALARLKELEEIEAAYEARLRWACHQFRDAGHPCGADVVRGLAPIPT